MTERPHRGARDSSCRLFVRRDYDSEDDSGDEIDFLKGLMQNRAREIHKTNLEKKKPPLFERNIKLMNVVMLLRRACNHAHLVEYPLDEFGEYVQDERLISYSGKVQVLDKLLKHLRNGGHKVRLLQLLLPLLP